MKNFIVLSVISIFALYSCNKEKNNTADSQSNPTKTDTVFSVDSLKINDSVKINDKITAAFKAGALVFPDISSRKILDSIYAQQQIHLDDYSKENILNALNKQKQEYFDETKKSITDFSKDYEQTLNQNSDMKIVSRENDFLTMKYTSDGYSGGAHGYYNEVYKVFDLKSDKTMQLSDILKNPDSNVWKRALMDNFLKNDVNVGQSQMLLVKEIVPNNNFYFDKNHLYFLYNQYEIAAYAAGPVLIKLPISDIKMMMQPEFLKRTAIK